MRLLFGDVWPGEISGGEKQREGRDRGGDFSGEDSLSLGCYGGKAWRRSRGAEEKAARESYPEKE